MLFLRRARKVKASSLGLSSTSKIAFFSISVLPEICQREVEGRAFVHLAFGPDAPAVAADDALHGRQADACAFKLLAVVQALKSPEQFVDVGHIEARAIVADEVDRFTA